MEQNNNINELSLKAIPDLYGKNFFIPDYQRGYRWGTRQVEQLMNDLCCFFDGKGKGDFYCLQPIVVKELAESEKNTYDLHSDTDDNRWYEVIDGQQRLTTIRIILALFKNVQGRFKHKFTIKYKTRPSLGEIFDKFIYDYNEDEYGIKVENEQRLDIDTWHILQAAKCILAWLKKGETQGVGLDYFTGIFLQYFTQQRGLDDKKSVQVIWYELRDKSDPNSTFKRLNDKKVVLNNAELIRAMFLSDSAEFECDESVIDGYPEEVQGIVKEREQSRKQSHIVEQWDIIEKQLRQPNFWAFVKDDASDENYSCRIEYLFDLISKKSKKEKDELYTYLRFDDMVKKHNSVKGLWDLWVKVESYFDTLLSWYQKRDYYHKIGYLIAEKGSSILYDLLDMSTKQTKTRFDKNINWLIKTNMMINVYDNIYTYSYDEDKQKSALSRILFFYNVESTRLATTQDNFPFELYKKESWTLEHIHAQNSERIHRTDKAKWEEWIDLNTEALKRLKTRFGNGHLYDPSYVIQILEENKKKVRNNTYVFDTFTRCFDSVNDYYNKMALAEGGSPEIHTISNMALLSGSVNSSISNSVFEVKRQLIMEKDASGEYIPYCTRLVFLKYYNKDKEDFSVQQSFYWSENDRKNYQTNIEAILKDVLAAKDPEEEERKAMEKEENEALKLEETNG
jgi:hypothetical protein